MSRRHMLRRSAACLFILSILGGLGGCATWPPIATVSRASAEPVRARLGRVGVASGRFTPTPVLLGPARGAGAGAAHGARVGAQVMAAATLPIVMYTMGIGLVVAIPLVAIGAIAGAPVGALGAQPAAEVEARRASLEQSIVDLSRGLHEALRDRVVAIGRVRAARAVESLTESGPLGATEGVDYRSLAPAGITTVLELRIEGFGLTGETGLRPPLWCFLTIQTRLVRTSDGRQLFEGTTTYAGRARPAEEWFVDAAAPFRDELTFAVDWLAEQIVDQVFLRVDPVDSTREIRVKPATLSDVEAYLVGDQGVVGGLQRFDATFEGLTVPEVDKSRLWILVRESLRGAAWGSELTVDGAVDGTPFTIELERDRDGRSNLRLDGLVFATPTEASDLARSFAAVASPLELRVDGYAAARRIRVTHGAGGVAVTDRGPGAPVRLVEETAGDRTLEFRVRPATLEHVNRLFGPGGPTSRGRRFDAKLEDMALGPEEAEPLVAVLRAATASPRRSKLELTGTLMGRPFDATVSTDRAGRARVVLDGFAFSDEREMTRFLAPFTGADQLDQLTLDGIVAGRKVRRSLGPGGAEVVR